MIDNPVVVTGLAEAIFLSLNAPVTVPASETSSPAKTPLNADVPETAATVVASYVRETADRPVTDALAWLMFAVVVIGVTSRYLLASAPSMDKPLTTMSFALPAVF